MTGLNPFIHHRQAYAMAPWIVPLILDKSGEKLLDPQASGGVVEGRMALFDLLSDARWGGLISGDRVEVDFRPTGEFPARWCAQSPATPTSRKAKTS